MLLLMPFAFLLLLFVFIEVAGFVAMANAVGLLGVFALIALGIVAGGFVIRTIGLASVQRMQQRAQDGETVGQELGGLVLGFLGGVLIIVPGFFTDLIGLALLIKPVQMLVWPRYGRQMAGHMPDVSRGRPWQSPNRGHATDRDDIVIDAEPTAPTEPSSSRSQGKRNPWGA